MADVDAKQATPNIETTSSDFSNHQMIRGGIDNRYARVKNANLSAFIAS